MPRKKNKDKSSFVLKHEILGIICLLIGSFYYLSLFSHSPLDPSFISDSGHQGISNLGGIVGSYLSGIFIFLLGGGSYFLGLYFLINSYLVLTKKRSELRILDFIVFFICSFFIAIYLQIQLGEIHLHNYPVNAGGTIGQIFGEIGRKYLGKWGIYLFVLFGTILTFVWATKLSFVETLNNSTIIVGKGLGSLSGHFTLYYTRLRKTVFKYSQKVNEILEKLYKKIAIKKISLPNSNKNTTSTATATNNSIQLAKPKNEIDIDRFIPKKFSGPKIKKRKDDKKLKNIFKQMPLKSINDNYLLPPLDILHDPDKTNVKVNEGSLRMNAKILEKKLKDFDIDGQVIEIHPGPVITMYEFQPAPGIKLSKIHGLSDDLSMAMGGRPVRIVAPLPNKAAVGIEIPNHDREKVYLKEIIADERFQSNPSKLTIALGKDIEGTPAIADLKKMPHLLVAGATGSGKSVSINTIIASILYNARPDEVRMIMIDPKMIELSIYDGIPHLLLPVVTEPQKANLALNWAVREMEKRYKLMSDVNARNVASYNKKIENGELKTGKPSEAALESDDIIIHEGKLPLIVIIIDEFADLMMVASKEVESSVCRLAQKARAAGIHVILATQRPSVDVITGIIKANFPSRISFKVTSKHDSKTIMDQVGAEHLLGMGDMLFIPPGSSQMQRLHGAFVSDDEVQNLVKFLKEQAQPVYNEEILTPVENTAGAGGADDFDEYYDQAVEEVLKNNKVSISSIQRRFRIGYNRAARIVEQMEGQGIVTAPNGQGQRQVIQTN